MARRIKVHFYFMSERIEFLIESITTLKRLRVERVWEQREEDEESRDNWI
jgi:hypothetical protein